MCRGYVFFFQAEDGIRDGTVTGVQTCALPISYRRETDRPAATNALARRARRPAHRRSEERRVGKSVDLGGRRIIKKKKIKQKEKMRQKSEILKATEQKEGKMSSR